MQFSVESMIKISLKNTLFIGLLTSLSGCFMGELGIYGQARENYLKSIKPMRDRWQRLDSSADIRQQDWIECGGTESGGFSPRQEVLTAEMRAGEANSWSASDRLFEKVAHCMISKGYAHSTKCSDDLGAKFKSRCGDR